jgi:O-antigen/teichoic acid export membrane protein
MEEPTTISIVTPKEWPRMLVSPRRYLPEKAFLRKLFTLASGTIVGQAIVVASSPLLTRLFTPAEFGQFAVLAAVIAITGISICLRLEFAVPVVSSDEEAAALMAGAVLVATINAIVVALLVLLLGPWLIVRVDAELLAHWLWLIPLTIWIWGIGSVMNYWALRRGRYRVNGVNRMLTLGTQAGGQLGLAVVGFGAPSLFLGYVLGYFVRLGHHLTHLPAVDRRLLFVLHDPRLVWRTVRSNWRYPAFIAPSSLLHNICEMIPAIIIATIYGPAAAGLYALTQRIMNIPTKLLGEAASEVFLGEGRALTGTALKQFFLRTTFFFLVLAICGMIPVLLFAQDFFAIVFGEGWRVAGLFAQLLMPLYIFRFVAHPISQLLNIMQKQHFHFIAYIFNFVATIVSFSMAFHFNWGVANAILVFSISSSLSFIFAIVISWRIIHQPAVAAEPDIDQI